MVIYPPAGVCPNRENTLANRRDETLAVLQQLGLTRDEAEEEISYREAEAERLLQEADDADRAEAARQARAHLFADAPFYIVPRRSRPAAEAVRAQTSRAAATLPPQAPRPVAAPGVSSIAAQRPAGDAVAPVMAVLPSSRPLSAPAEVSQPEAIAASTSVQAAVVAPPAAPAFETQTPALSAALRSMAIGMASSKRIVVAPVSNPAESEAVHTNGFVTAPPRPDEPLGLRLPRTTVAPIAQGAGLRARVETPVVEPLPLEMPLPAPITPGPAAPEQPDNASTREIPLANSAEPSTLASSTTMTANGNSSETGTAAETEAQSLSAHSNGVAPPNLAPESSSVPASIPASTDTPAVPRAEGEPAPAIAISPVTETPAPAPPAAGAPTPAAEVTAKAEAPSEPAIGAPVAATGAAPEARTVVAAPAAPPRLSRKKRRELKAAEVALAASKETRPATESRGLLGPFKRYGHWTTGGPKWRFALGLGGPILGLLLVATAAYGQTQGWYSSEAAATASVSSVTDPSLSNKAYTSYVLAMNAMLSTYSTSLDTINRISNQPLSTNPNWASQLRGAAVAIQGAGDGMRKVGVPLCVAGSHATLMVGVTNMDNAAANILNGLRDTSSDDLTTAANRINSAKPLLQKASTDINATRC